MKQIKNFDTKIFTLLKEKKLNYMKISFASSQNVNDWSYGEITSADTINYRTLIPEYNGLFCPRIFGPVKDYICACGLYSFTEDKDFSCERCKVDITVAKKRRYRMGHIKLASPVIHFWFLKSRWLSILLNIASKNIKKVVYNESYIILKGGSTNLIFGEVISQKIYDSLIEEYDDNFEACTGIYGLELFLKTIDLNYEKNNIISVIQNLKNSLLIEKLTERLYVINDFLLSGNSILDILIYYLPVLPAELRPLVPLDDEKYANSDINLLYRRIINRNNRLKRLIKLSSPLDIIMGEQILLQDSVNSLIENEKTKSPFVNFYTKKPLRSLAETLKGKYGHFRANLLGKRVDYSGRSVIVVGPDLKLNQCGLPIKMAYELFKPIILNKLLTYYNISLEKAKSILKEEKWFIRNILENITKNYPILLNRAPTLHRLGIQAFYPLLINENAIRLHPLVCCAFNADFDGDQMAVHIPITKEAIYEAEKILLSINNLLSPANGNPVFLPSQDSLLGLYFLTKMNEVENNKIKYFLNINEVIVAYELNYVFINEKIKIFKICIKNKEIKNIVTTVGRVILFSYLPSFFDFNFININLCKKNLSELFKIFFLKYGFKNLIQISEILCKIGFKFSTLLGLSMKINDLNIDFNKGFYLKNTFNKIICIDNLYKKSYISSINKYKQTLDVWCSLNKKIKFILKKKIYYKLILDKNSILKKDFSCNNMSLMIESGARGTLDQLFQLSAMRGLMSKANGSFIEKPILSNLVEGLNIYEYFISTHGARKGLSDTALKTANAGYLTRRLVDVVQDVFITLLDCNTKKGIYINKDIDIFFYKNLLGRKNINNILNPYTLNIIIKKNIFITEKEINLIKQFNIFKIKIRSAIYCHAPKGVCAHCYGFDLSKNKLIKLGESIGIIAAQSIGEPGTQLTMRTFHTGGANLVIFKDNFQYKKIFSNYSGFLKFINFKFLNHYKGFKINLSLNAKICIYNEFGFLLQIINIPYGVEINYDNFMYIKKNQILFEYNSNILYTFAKNTGLVRFVNFQYGINVNKINIFYKDYYQINYQTNSIPYIEIYNNDIIEKYTFINQTIILVKEDQFVNIGEKISYIDNIDLSFSDITGGLVKVANLFEIRSALDSATIIYKAGYINSIINSLKKVELKINLIDKEEIINIDLINDLNISCGIWLERGDIVSHSSFPINKIINIKNLDFVINNFIKEIQSVYSPQGIYINNKHIEIILFQMITNEKILFIREFIKENNELTYEAKIYSNTLKDKKVIGITRSSLLKDSFISAASFQETSKVLTKAAFFGSKDYLYGLKENVILGNLIPSGTGFNYEEK